MKKRRVVMLSTALLMVLLCSLFSPAQQSVATAANATVPPLIQFSNVATDEGGSSLSGVVSITFTLYNAQQGGEPLWTETQNDVQLDATGHYSVQLGITKPAGVPTTLFTSGEARWLGVQIAEQGEQPRVLLLSVPYALKAGDAATIGGLPPSAFVLTATGTASAASAPSSFVAATTSAADAPTGTDVTGSGTADFIPLWTSTSNIADSVLFQSGTGTTAKVGIGTTTPATTLDVKGSGTIRGTLSLPATAVATATAGKNSQPLSLAASAFNSATSAAVNQTFQWLAQPADNDTATPSGTLNLLFAEGAVAPAQTGLQIANNGLITFAAGQTFPGAGGGTITGVTAGTDLIGGGTSGNVTLNLNTANVPLLAAANTFTSTETVTASGTAINATGSAFGVYGTATGTGSTVGVFGKGADGLQGSGTVYGVYGASTSTTGAGVYGTAPGFGLYGTATGSGSTVGVFGSGADGVQGSGTVNGVYGASTTAGGIGVQGSAPAFGLYGTATGSGSTVGVFGKGADGVQGSGTVYGVYGASTTAGATGVYGTAPTFGLYGTATGGGSTVGVFGSGADGVQGSGTINGVYGASNTAGATGVYGTAPQFGLYGTATGSGNTVGVFGSGADGLQGSGTVNGVYGASNTPGATGVYGTGSYGVYSVASTNASAGTFGVFEARSATGLQAFWSLPICVLCRDVTVLPGAGVWADTNWNGDDDNDFYYPALLATADANIAAVVLNNSEVVPTLITYNFGSGGDVLRAEGARGSCTLSGSGDAACTGTLKSVVATTNGVGARRVETYSVQSAENWFEDAGTAQLVNGAARVDLESVFGQTVNTNVEYHIFLTPDGDCKGLYVSAKTASGFEVRELGGGASSIAFDYRIMAKRAGYENVRLKNVTQQFNKQAAQSKRMQRPVHAAQPSASPTFQPAKPIPMPAAPQPAVRTPTPQLKAAAPPMVALPK